MWIHLRVLRWRVWGRRPDRSDTKARSDRPLSLRAKSDLHRGRRSHFWSGPFVWRLASLLVRCATLAFFHAFAVMYEEPMLKQAFGTEYESFRTNVPRWIPRLTPRRAA